MEAFFKTHAYLVEHTNAPVRRALMDEINWNDRLIGIKGSRGVGKTTFLLQYAREHFSVNDRKCLYVNMNNFYFQGKSLTDFAGDFHRNGGQVLLIDQVYKLPDWSTELKRCYERYPGLKIIFTGSSVMRLKDENPELNGICSSYNLKGFSLREFINLRTGLSLSSYSFQDILDRHEMIAASILRQVDPNEHMRAYLRHGYYPFFLEKTNFTENLLKVMNMMVEVDILLIQQIELKYLNKLKKLVYMLATEGNVAPNVSQLAADVQTSRATVMNYFKFLADARLIHMIYRKGEQQSKKPARISLHNTNLLFAIFPRFNDEEALTEAFFQQTLCPEHQVSVGDRSCGFYVNGKRFRICMEEPHRQSSDVYYIRQNLQKGHDKQIPLWMLGFLY